MTLQEYIIDHRDIDWPCVLREWSWLLPEKFSLWLMNRFGDLFIELEDESIHMLDIGGGTFERIAANKPEFAELIDEADNANKWLMIPLVDQLVASEFKLQKGQCYSYKLPPIVGGNYQINNIFVLMPRFISNSRMCQMEQKSQ